MFANGHFGEQIIYFLTCTGCLADLENLENWDSDLEILESLENWDSDLENLENLENFQCFYVPKTNFITFGC